MNIKEFIDDFLSNYLDCNDKVNIINHYTDNDIFLSNDVISKIYNNNRETIDGIFTSAYEAMLLIKNSYEYDICEPYFVDKCDGTLKSLKEDDIDSIFEYYKDYIKDNFIDFEDFVGFMQDFGLDDMIDEYYTYDKERDEVDFA